MTGKSGDRESAVGNPVTVNSEIRWQLSDFAIRARLRPPSPCPSPPFRGRGDGVERERLSSAISEGGDAAQTELPSPPSGGEGAGVKVLEQADRCRYGARSRRAARRAGDPLTIGPYSFSPPCGRIFDIVNNHHRNGRNPLRPLRRDRQRIDRIGFIGPDRLRDGREPVARTLRTCCDVVARRGRRVRPRPSSFDKLRTRGLRMRRLGVWCPAGSHTAGRASS